MDYKKMTHLIPWILGKWKSSGLDKHQSDERDFDIHEVLGWGLGYTTKQNELSLPVLAVKDQHESLCCQWFASTYCNETNELLSPRSIAAKASRLGLCGDWGMSDLPSGCKVQCSWGQLTEETCPTVIDNWSSFRSFPVDNYPGEAIKRKAQSYWSCNDKNAILKALDEGFKVKTGIDWFTGFNQSGGFCDPWIITQAVGYKVGGHAVTIIGYNQNYHGKKVFKLVNSYSSQWGDNGYFYVDQDYLVRNMYGAFVILPIGYHKGLTVDDILTNFAQKNVKGDGSPGIYYIQEGMKRVYPNKDTFMAWTADPKDFTVVPQKELDKIKESAPMKAELGPYYKAFNAVVPPIKYK